VVDTPWCEFGPSESSMRHVVGTSVLFFWMYTSKYVVNGSAPSLARVALPPGSLPFRSLVVVAVPFLTTIGSVNWADLSSDFKCAHCYPRFTYIELVVVRPGSTFTHSMSWRSMRRWPTMVGSDLGKAGGGCSRRNTPGGTTADPFWCTRKVRTQVNRYFCLAEPGLDDDHKS
jgi:hypothetical protein